MLKSKKKSIITFGVPVLALSLTLFTLTSVISPAESSSENGNTKATTSSKILDSNLETISFEGNYLPLDSANELFEIAELIIVAEPIDDFVNRRHVSSYSEDNSLEDYYTETVVNIKQIIKQPSDLELTENTEFPIIEPSVGLVTNKKNEKVKIVTDGYTELQKNDEYLIFLMKNYYGDYALVSNELSKYKLMAANNSTRTINSHYHHKEDKEKILKELKNMPELQIVKGIENLN